MSFLYIALKDLKVILRDRKALLLLVAMPVLLTTILGFSLRGVFHRGPGEGIKKVRIAVVEDQPGVPAALEKLVPAGELARLKTAAGELDMKKLFIDNFLETAEIRKLMEYQVLDGDAARTALADKQVDAVVYLPNSFAVDYIMGKRISLRVVSNTGDEIKKSILKGLLQGFTDTLSIPRIGISVVMEERVYEGVGLLDFLLDFRGLGEKAEKLLEGNRGAVDFRHFTEQGRQEVSAFQYYAAAMGVMFILFAAGYGVKSILEEKEERAMARLVLAGRRKWEIVAGKALAVFAVSLGQMTVMIVFSAFALGVYWGRDLVALALLTITAVFAVAGLSMLMAAVIKNHRGAELFQMVAVQFMALLGGSFMPIYAMPELLQSASAFTINGLALRGYLRLMEGAGFSEVYLNVLILAGFGLAALAAGGAALRLEE
ncbi:MAG: ABC transporter permease [Bacillota bacterium]